MDMEAIPGMILKGGGEVPSNTWVELFSGVLAGIAVVSVMQVIFVYALWIIHGKVTRIQALESKPALALFSKELGEKFKFNLMDFTNLTETCDWFNELLNNLYFDQIGSDNIRQLMEDRIKHEFKDLQAEYPSLVEALEVEHFTLGNLLPELRNVRLRSTDSLKTDLFLVFDLVYGGGASIGVKIVSFGRTISIKVALARIEGKLIAELVDWPVPSIQFYFYAEPTINFSLQFGEQKFRWFAQVVSNKIKQFLRKQLIYPNGHTYHFTQTGQDWHTSTKAQFSSLGEALNQPGTLILHAESAQGLPQKGRYYFQAKIGKQKVATKTNAAKTTDSPVWGETLFFDLRKTNLASDVLQIKIKDVVTTRSISFVEIPFSSLNSGFVYATSFPMMSMDDTKREKAGTVHFSVLLTMKEKTTFLDQISRFHNQAPMEFERVDHFDEQIGGFVMVTDGDQEQFDELPSLQSVRKGTSFSGLPEPVEEPEKSRRKSFSLISMIRGMEKKEKTT